MNPRRKRATRPQARRYQVTERDREIVSAVGRMAQATTDQLCRLFFTEPSTASRRLSKLVALRLLDVHVCSRSEPNVYTVGGKGLELLEDMDVDRTEVHRGRVGRTLDHHLRLLNEMRVEFVLAARSAQGVRVTAFRSDLDLRRAAGSPPPAYIPDAIIELELPSGALALVVEIDTGTEGASVFATKVETTVAIWRAGSTCWGARPGAWRPVAFVPSAGRARSLARAILGAGGGELWLIAEFERLREVGALGPIFATADEVVAMPRGAPILYRGALASRPREVPR